MFLLLIVVGYVDNVFIDYFFDSRLFEDRKLSLKPLEFFISASNQEDCFFERFLLFVEVSLNLIEIVPLLPFVHLHLSLPLF